MHRVALIQDVRNAARSLRRRPSVAVVAMACLSVAITGNLIVFALINGLAMRPLPFDQPDRLVFVGEMARGAPRPSVAPISAPNLLDWRQRQTVFDDLLPFRQRSLGLVTDGDSVTPVRGVAVAPGFFSTLGVEAALGRTFRPDDGGPGNERVALITAGFYRRHFGPDPSHAPSAAERFSDVTLRFADGVYDIVGVLPVDFEWFGATPEVWVALGPIDSEAPRSRRDFFALGRLRAGVSEAAARAHIESVAANLALEYPEANRGWNSLWVNLRHDLPSPNNRRLVGLIQAALIVVMLIACVDIASLFLVRGRSRARELSVRAALGASSGRLARQMAIESLIVSTTSAVIGLGLATLCLGALRQQLTDQLPRFHQPFVDLHVVGACAALVVVASLVFGLAPVLQARRMQPVDALREGGRGKVGTERWAIQIIVVAQIALSMALLGGAGLLVRSFLDYQGQDAGFDTDELVIFSISLPDSTYPTPTERIRATEALIDHLQTGTGLDGAAIANLWPRASRVPSATVTPPGRTLDGPTAPRAILFATTGGLFDAAGLEIERGDLATFDAARVDSEPVVVINRSLAARFWAGADAVGQQLEVAGTRRRVVAVVADVRHAIVDSHDHLDTAYIPWSQDPSAVLRGTLRLGASPGGEPGTVDSHLATTAIRQAVAEVDPRLVIADLQPIDAMVDKVFFSTRLFAGVLTGFGLLALLLAGLGTYGVLAYAISLRRAELGLRSALGASRGDLFRGVLAHGFRLGLIGLALGLPLVWVAHRVVVGIMATRVAVRPTTIALAAVVLLVATLLAALRPALLASKIDPAEALRRV